MGSYIVPFSLYLSTQTSLTRPFMQALFSMLFQVRTFYLAFMFQWMHWKKTGLISGPRIFRMQTGAARDETPTFKLPDDLAYLLSYCQVSLNPL